MSIPPQHLITLDMEGVLTPEIWMAVAESTGCTEFTRTTRDEPDYEKLMQRRLKALAANDITFTQLNKIVDQLDPLPGAQSFLTELRATVPVVILTDSFEQLAAPLLAKLGQPLTLGHRLEIVEDRVVGAPLRLPDAKRRAVKAYQGLGYTVIAAGDSFNDIAMLTAADHSVLFRPSAMVVARHPEMRPVDSFDELLDRCLAPLTGITT